MSTITSTRTLTQNLRQPTAGKRLGTTANGAAHKSQLRSSGGIATDALAPGSAPSCTVQVYVQAEIAKILDAGPYTLRIAHLGEDEAVSQEYDTGLDLIETEQGFPGLSDRPPQHIEGAYFKSYLPMSFKLELGIEPEYWIDHNPAPDSTGDGYDDEDFKSTRRRIEWGQIYEVDSNGNGSVNLNRTGKFPSERVFGFSNKILATPYVFKSKNGGVKQVSTLEYLWPPGHGFYTPPEDLEWVQVWFERDPNATDSGEDWGDQTTKHRLAFHASDTSKVLYYYDNGIWSDTPLLFRK